MLSEGEEFGWYLVVFFGFGVLTFAISLLPNSSCLVLSREGRSPTANGRFQMSRG